MDNNTSPTPSDIQKTEQKQPIKINYEQKINSEMKQAEESLRDMGTKMPLSISGIIGILFGFVGLFIGRLGFGILAIICAIIARKYQNDLAGFYLDLALGIIDIIIFLLIWTIFHFTSAGFWI